MTKTEYKVVQWLTAEQASLRTGRSARAWWRAARLLALPYMHVDGVRYVAAYAVDDYLSARRLHPSSGTVVGEVVEGEVIG